MFDFSIFQNLDNLIFFAIAVLFAISFFIVIFYVFYKAFKILKDIFSKDEEFQDLGKNIEPVVNELEESKKERQGYEKGKNIQMVENFKYYSIGKTNGKIDSEDSKNVSQKEIFDKNGRNDISDRLESLKNSGKRDEEEDNAVSKIKIPRAKRIQDEGENKDVFISEDTSREKDNYDSDNSKALDPKSTQSQPRAAFSQVISRAYDLKISKQDELKENINNNDKGDKSFVGSKNKFNSKANAPKESHKSINNDASMFEGKNEISRIELRQKLRYDPKIYNAQRSIGLNMSPTQRARLEKEIFSQSYGENISKTDLKWGLAKLNQKMVGAKDIAEKGKIRKEIKFLKKIGGIK